MEERNVSISLNEARFIYNTGIELLREIVFRGFSSKELNPSIEKVNVNKYGFGDTVYFIHRNTITKGKITEIKMDPWEGFTYTVRGIKMYERFLYPTIETLIEHLIQFQDSNIYIDK
jgi:hypothetical protein